MNIFQLDYAERLRAWAQLREQIATQTVQQKCVHTDDWWQAAPLVNHYLHLHSPGTWPSPWELLTNNVYCTVARGLGMCYTLYMSGVDQLELATAIDDHGFDHVLVLVDCDKYILNWWPDTVLNNNLDYFTVRDRYDVSSIMKLVK